MSKISITVIALSIKVAIIYYLLMFGLEYYNKDVPLHEQNIRVWLFLILPIAMGYESLIHTLFSGKIKTPKQP